jgi:MYXO-CTERM domain-containing protein
MLDKQIPDGQWHALLTLRSGLLKRSARATISFPATEAPSSPYLTYLIIAGLVLLLLAGVVATRLRRRC